MTCGAGDESEAVSDQSAGAILDWLQQVHERIGENARFPS
jgi:hypothetical protein